MVTSEHKMQLVREIKKSINVDNTQAIKKADKWINLVKYYMKLENEGN